MTVSTRSVAVAPSGSLPAELEADDLRDEHRDRLAEHRRLGLDPADAPAEHAQAVDHRRVRVGPDQRVRVRQRRLASAVRCATKTTRARYSRLTWWTMPVSGRDDLEVVGSRSAPSGGTRNARGCAGTRSSALMSKASAVPASSTWTEWSMTSSTGWSGLIFFGSPPSRFMASRIAARSTTAGTPVKSWSKTRLGRKAISRSGSAFGFHCARPRMSSAVTVCSVLVAEQVLQQDLQRERQERHVEPLIGERVEPVVLVGLAVHGQRDSTRRTTWASPRPFKANGVSRRSGPRLHRVVARTRHRGPAEPLRARSGLVLGIIPQIVCQAAPGLNPASPRVRGTGGPPRVLPARSRPSSR